MDNISHLQFDLRAAENEKVLKRRPPESTEETPTRKYWRSAHQKVLERRPPESTEETPIRKY
jgi:hypothetical protein